MDVRPLRPMTAKLLLHLLLSGERVDNISSLATKLGMSRPTIYAAADQLTQMGLLREDGSVGLEFTVVKITNEVQPFSAPDGNDYTGWRADVTAEVRASWEAARERMVRKGLGWATGEGA